MRAISVDVIHATHVMTRINRFEFDDALRVGELNSAKKICLSEGCIFGGRPMGGPLGGGPPISEFAGGPGGRPPGPPGPMG